MFANLSRREKIMIYFLLAFIALFVMYKYVMLKQAALYTEAKSEYELQNNKVNQYRNIVLTLENVKKQETETTKKLQEVSAPFNIDIMGGEQVREIGKIIESTGLKVEAVSPVNPNVQKDYYTQDIKFKVTGTYAALEQFFFETEYSKYAFVIKKFNIAPNAPAGTASNLTGLHYSNLIADLTVTVIGDKSAKVQQPALQTFKLDLFKPDQEDMQEMQSLKLEQDLAEEQEKLETPDQPSVAENPPAPDLSLDDEATFAAEPPEAEEKEDKPNYSFNKE